MMIRELTIIALWIFGLLSACNYPDVATGNLP